MVHYLGITYIHVFNLSLAWPWQWTERTDPKLINNPGSGGRVSLVLKAIVSQFLELQPLFFKYLIYCEGCMSFYFLLIYIKFRVARWRGMTSVRSITLQKRVHPLMLDRGTKEKSVLACPDKLLSSCTLWPLLLT